MNQDYGAAGVLYDEGSVYERLSKISEKVITGDAMHTQRGLATQILEAQADYLFPVKENQPQLSKNIQSLFAPEYPKPGAGFLHTFPLPLSFSSPLFPFLEKTMHIWIYLSKHRHQR